MKKIIIFDLDGVIFDTPEIAAQYMFEQYPTLTREIQREFLCGNIHEAIEKFRLTVEPNIETEEEIEIRKKHYIERKMKCPLYPGIYELIKDLYNKGYILTINTSATDQNCIPLLENAGIKDMFDYIATKEVSKNKSEKFTMIQERYEVNKEDMIFITDTLGDLKEAQHSGITTIAVTWGAHDESFFIREKYDNLKAIVHSSNELKHLLETF